MSRTLVGYHSEAGQLVIVRRESGAIPTIRFTAGSCT